MRPNKLLITLTAFAICIGVALGMSWFEFGPGIKGNGNISTQERKIESFEDLSVGGAFKVYLEQDQKTSLKLVADENLLEIIETEVKGNTLYIRNTESVRYSTKMEVHISNPEYEKLKISGACSLISKEKINADNLTIKGSGASKVDMEVDSKDLRVDISGAGSLVLKGKSDNQVISMSGASSYKGYELKAKNSDISISGAGSAKVFSSDKIDARVSGAGSIKYLGEPENVQSSVSGAGSIKKAKK